MPTLIVVPISQCNLSCKYCFGIKEDNKILPLNQFKKIVKQFIKYSLHNKLHFCDFIFLGGEFFMLKNWKDYLDFLFDYQKKNPSTIFTNRITTNGTLLSKDIRAYIKKHDIKLGVSLDGPKEFHDCNRIFKGNQGSFKIIDSNIEKLKKEKVEFGTLSIITKENVGFPEKMFKFFQKKGLDNKFNPVLPVKRAEKNLKNIEITDEELSNFYIKVFELWFNQKNKPVRNYLCEIITENVFIELLKLPISYYTFCAFSRNCYSIISVYPDGTIGGCDRLEGIEEFQYGNIKDDNLPDILNSKKYIKLKNRKLAEKCTKCEFCYLCEGGCTFESYISNHNLDEPMYYCEAYKTFFKHVNYKLKKELDKIAQKLKIGYNELANMILRNELENVDLPYGIYLIIQNMYNRT